MKKLTKNEILKWNDIFKDSPWRMFIETENPIVYGDKQIFNDVCVKVVDGKIYPATGIDYIDELEVIGADSYTCEIN